VHAAAPLWIQDAGHSSRLARWFKWLLDWSRGKQTGNDRAIWLHRASRLVRGLRSQSRALASVSVLTVIYPAQQEVAPLSPERSA